MYDFLEKNFEFDARIKFLEDAVLLTEILLKNCDGGGYGADDEIHFHHQHQKV